MIECASPSRREEIEKVIEETYNACLRGDYRCFSACPYLEECWEPDSKREFVR